MNMCNTILQQLDDNVCKQVVGAENSIEKAQLLSTEFTTSEDYNAEKKQPKELKMQAKKDFIYTQDRNEMQIVMTQKGHCFSH